MLVPVVLSGGVGSRLWPLSRELNPKQFLSLAGDLSLLQQTLRRARGLQGATITEPIIVCNNEHRFLVAEQLRQQQLAAQAIILEPVGKNTAPALAVAALTALSTNPAAILLVMPADHVIKESEPFDKAVSIGLMQAQKGQLVTFGIVPERPETGYGYIRYGAELAEGCFAIDAFVEKPALDTASAYVSSGEYLWNSGMFMLDAQAYLDELRQFAPDILMAAEAAVAAAEEDLDFTRLNKAAFQSCPSDSIDYAVMEHTEKGVVVPLSCGWSDVGSWDSLWKMTDNKDDDGNVTRGDVIAHDTVDSYLYSESRLVTSVGIDNLVVVETADAVLVANKNRVQDVKSIVEQLKVSGREEVKTHKKVYRPWGTYESLAVAERFQVKRIIVNPGQRLSLQMHQHRAEHWVVVSGTALVTCGEQQLTLIEDQSTYIPLGTKHRLENTGKIPLELIEVQSGSYLGEDDIVRFEDMYARSH